MNASFWKPQLRFEVLELTGHTVTALGLCGGLLSCGRECLTGQFTYLTLYITQWRKVTGLARSLARLLTISYMNNEGVDAGGDGSAFYTH